MTKVLFDINVVLAVLLDRKTYAEASVAVWSVVEAGSAEGCCRRTPSRPSTFWSAVTAAAARLAGWAYIVTRDPKGFLGSPVRCLTPEAILPLLKKTRSPG